LSRLAAAALALALAGCGFQLRGDSPTGLESLSVSAAVPARVAVEIRRQLSGGPTRLEANAARAQASLQILAENTEKNILTLTSAGSVFDYMLRLRVTFQVTDARSREIVPATSIELERILTYSESAPLAKEAEEQFLYDDMRQQAATRILRRIVVVRAHQAAP
jgi:LPS-assembly lipoprotein